jgi:hypothetical protein
MTRQELLEERAALDRKRVRFMAVMVAGTFLLALCIRMLIGASSVALILSTVTLLIGPTVGFIMAFKLRSSAAFSCPACSKPFGAKGLTAVIATGTCSQCGASVLDDSGTNMKESPTPRRSFSKVFLWGLGAWAVLTAFHWAAHHSSAVLSPENSRLLCRVSEGAIGLILLSCIVNLLYLPAKMAGLALRLVKDCTFRELALSFLFFLLLFCLFGISLVSVAGTAPALQKNEKPNPAASGNGAMLSLSMLDGLLPLTAIVSR